MAAATGEGHPAGGAGGQDGGGQPAAAQAVGGDHPAPAPGPAADQRGSARPPGGALTSVWERFQDQFQAQVSVLEDAAMAVLSDDLGADLRHQAHGEAHKLTGSLGTLGLERGSEIARQIESWLEAPGPPDTAAIRRLADAVVALRSCVDAGPSPGPVAASGPATNGEPFILLVDDEVAPTEASVIRGLRQEALLGGMAVEAVTGIEAARRFLAGRRPEAVLMAATGPAMDDALTLIGELKVSVRPVPVVMLTRAGAFTDRLEAARLGVQGFLHTPLAPGDVLLAVHGIIKQARTTDATVLSVDDDPAILAALVALLEPQGQRVVTLSGPERFLDKLQEETPDLVILDVEMPAASGVELCQLMRGDQRWSRLPVLFLTARTDAATVHSIFAAGADDFVAKPIVGPELTTRIVNRLERSTLLRRMAETDVLTGVANRPTAVSATAGLLRRGERFGQPVAIALLDIDRLQRVNDTAGYDAGDGVVAWLGQLIRRSLGREDVVGRWGGQEFVVALFGLTRTDGVQRLAELLEELRQKRFADGQGGSFGASFSAGVAQYPDDGVDVRSLFRAADGAVRRSKAAGGDRVVPVGWSAPEAGMTDVVVVEDDDALAAVLLHGLATRSYRTQRFDDGNDAVAALQGPSPQVSARVVLLDWGLPSMDGLRVLRRLSETGVLTRTRVIMLTARDSESEVLQALDLGAFDHVAKPFSVPVLMKRVHRAMDY
jgi:diguanylate cyclase (GGDEF)-like protein